MNVGDIKKIDDKALNKHDKEKKGFFDKIKHDIFIDGESDKLIIDISPESSVRLVINGKEPGFDHQLSQVCLEYCYSCQFPNNVKEAYEKLFLDMFKSSKTLFTRWDEIELAWKVIDDIKSNVKTNIQYSNHQELISKIRDLNHENL